MKQNFCLLFLLAPTILISVLCDQGSTTHMGGTMRLGSRRTYFQVMDCKSAKLYGNRGFIDERHRHRYEVNPNMVMHLENSGLSFTGKDASGQRMEIVELPNHPYFVGVQFHPEFKSRPGKPSALFLGLIAAACGQLESVLKEDRLSQKIGTGKGGMSNGNKMVKTYQNGSPTKPANGSFDDVYRNCNGVQV
ncbi:hypothetical protein PVL29_001071 [Vitis rotundifolia]|uniref:CTP synthase (glutamine hydrolyzing) n=1 Tax=Vitis rotundifolia TaxID=103349 RepID=A0AA39ALJ7_VITRO|nr:hypothetical protein PVL29_001071 [Vitis rotundifolia]